MTGFDDVDYYMDTELIEDPFPYLAHLRSQCPVVHLPKHDVMAITSYEEAARVLRDHEHFSSCNSVSGPFPGFSEKPAADEDIDAFIAAHRGELPMNEYVVTMDPPDQQQHRSLITRLFTPKRMRENEEFMRGLADRLIGPLLDHGRVEVLQNYSQPFALLVIADLLGVPEEHHHEFQRNLGGLPKVGPDADKQQMSPDPLQFSLDRFASYIADRREDPRGDVLTKLATATYADGSEPDVASISRMAAFLFAAGQDTTAKLMTMSLRYLADDPDLQATLRADPTLIPGFIEEVLRFDGIVKHIGRMARVTTEVAGVTIPAGQTVGVFPGAANRDPEHFDDPDTFRPGRSNAGDQLGFGRGIHSCPGGPLARLETTISIETFLARTSTIGLDEEHHGPAGDRRFDFDNNYINQGLRSLHLVLEPAVDR